jgi:hypothetical protein
VSAELMTQQELVRLLRTRCEKQEEELRAALLREVHQGLRINSVEYSHWRTTNGDTHSESSPPRIADLSSIHSARSANSGTGRQYRHNRTTPSCSSPTSAPPPRAPPVPAPSRKLAFAEQEARDILRQISSSPHSRARSKSERADYDLSSCTLSAPPAP